MPYQTGFNHYQNTKFIVTAVGDGPYTTIQSAINAANQEYISTGQMQSVFIRAGTYTENLTLFSNVSLDGERDLSTIIVGTHTPPALGGLNLNSLTLLSDTDVLATASAGVGANPIIFNFCAIGVTNGYLINMPNWTSTIFLFYCLDTSSTDNGIINNTVGGALIALAYCHLGTGSISCKSNGNFICEYSTIVVPTEISGAGGAGFTHCSLQGSLTLSGTSSAIVVQSDISSGGASAIITGGGTSVTLDNVVITSVAATAIAGSGTVSFGEVTYTSNHNVAGTIGSVFNSRLETGELKLNTATVGVLIATAGVVSGVVPLTVANGGTGTVTNTLHGILMGNGVGAIQATGEPSNGQLIIGKTGDFPQLASLTSTGTTITITPGAGTINLETSAGLATTYTAENASTCSPALGNLNIVGTATNGINTTAAGSTMTIAMASPYSDGNFTFSTATAGITRILTITNTDNSAADSGAALQVSVGGATSTGDAYTNYLVTGAGTYSIGIDNSDSDLLKITTGASPSAGSTIMTIAGSGNVYANLGDFYVQRSQAGGIVESLVSNTDNTNAASSAGFFALVGGTSAGDPYTNYLVSGGGTYSVGIDNSDSDKFKITASTTPSGGTDLFTMTNAGVITLANDLDVTEGGTGVSTLTSHGILMGNGAGDINATAEPSNGQLLIGKAGDFPQLATLTAGAGISVTNAAGAITVAATGQINSLAIQTFVYTGGAQTYTPTAGMKYCIIECVGGGGGGGGSESAAAKYSAGAGGGSGEYAYGIFSAATIGASQTVTIGVGGAGNSAASGSNGGNTSVGALISANGGTGGGFIAAISGSATGLAGGAGGTGGSGGNLRFNGARGGEAFIFNVTVAEWSGCGNGGMFSGATDSIVIYSDASSQTTTGRSATGYGGGGGGALTYSNAVAAAGGAGSGGLVKIIEYI